MNSFSNKQRGATLIGILFFGGILVFLGIIGAQLAPTYIEYLEIGKALNKTKDAGSAPEVRSSFDKAAQINNIKTISGKDLVFTQDGAKTVVSYAYSKEIHLAGPAYLLMKYAGRSN
jgi:hypothetical protein